MTDAKVSNIIWQLLPVFKQALAYNIPHDITKNLMRSYLDNSIYFTVFLFDLKQRNYY